MKVSTDDIGDNLRFDVLLLFVDSKPFKKFLLMNITYELVLFSNLSLRFRDKYIEAGKYALCEENAFIRVISLKVNRKTVSKFFR